MNVRLDRPFTLSFVREIYSILMRGIPHNAEHSGTFRDRQNYISSGHGGLRNAIHIPPPPMQMHDALLAWEAFAKRAENLPALVRHALLHYQFECIHPFIDGNGRVGRLLIAYFMRADKLIDKPLFVLSPYFERNRKQYYDRLNGVTRAGEWNEWMLFYLRGVEEQAHEAFDRFQKVCNLRRHYRKLVGKGNTSIKAALLLDELFAQPATTATTATKLMAVSPTTAQKVIDQLVELNILKEITDRKRGRVYTAHEILDIGG